MKQPIALILDRDGVINADPHGYISHPKDWHALPGSLEAIATLNQLNIWVAIASNQSGVGRGFFSEQDLLSIDTHMRACLFEKGGHFDFIAYCLHHPDDNCPCRKPKPGLLQQISQALHIPLNKQVWFVGDSQRDIDAALAADCTPILVETGNGAHTISKETNKKYLAFSDLAAVVAYIQQM